MKEPACVQVPIRLCYTLGHWSISVNIFLTISFFSDEYQIISLGQAECQGGGWRDKDTEV